MQLLNCHLRGNCHPPPFNDLDGGIQILQMLPFAWAQSSSLAEHVNGRCKSKAHGELAEGEELSGLLFTFGFVEFGYVGTHIFR